MKVIDGAALVQSLDPKAQRKMLKTFKDYSEQMFIPAVLKQIQFCKRCVGCLQERKPENVCQTEAGAGERMQVSEETPIHWKTVLWVDDNTAALFHFLAKQLSDAKVNVPAGTVIITTFEENIWYTWI